MIPLRFQLTDHSTMTFGKHKGTLMANVPEDYLLWLYNNKNIPTKLELYIEQYILNIGPQITKK